MKFFKLKEQGYLPYISLLQDLDELATKYTISEIKMILEYGEAQLMEDKISSQFVDAKIISNQEQ